MRDQKFKCIIVEDEPIAAGIIENFLLRNHDFQIIGKCSDAVYASNLLSTQDVDLMFLDLNLPVIKGFDFLKRIKNPPSVIVTTAYHEYASEGYNLNIIDYLLKPIAYDRFLGSLNKFRYARNAKEVFSEMENRDYLFVNFQRKKTKIFLDDIFYIESLREYVKIHTKVGVYDVKIPLSRIGEQLDKTRFQRIHKSYIIANNKIEAFCAANIIVNGKKLPIGKTYKELVNIV